MSVHVRESVHIATAYLQMSETLLQADMNISQCKSMISQRLCSVYTGSRLQRVRLQRAPGYKEQKI